MKRGKYLTLLLLFILLIMETSSFALSPRSDNGHYFPRIAFNYYPLKASEVAYLSRFDLVVTHNLVDRETVRRLKAGGAKLAFYEWLPAFYYGNNPDGWQKLVYRHKNRWVLDPGDNDPDPMGIRNGNRDFFYDMAESELVRERVKHLTRLVRTGGYDGIFFDWGSGWHSLVEYDCRFATDRFQKKHPGVDYDTRVADFLQKLKNNGVMIILNGGFRSPGARLDAKADVDIVESMFTTDRCDSSGKIIMSDGKAGKGCDTWFNPVSKSMELSQRLPASARQVNPRITFFFLNYAFPYYDRTRNTRLTGGRPEAIHEAVPDRQAIHYGLALSYLGDAAGFTNGPDVSLEYVRDDVYFHDPGKPVGKTRTLNEGTALRYFSKGFVIVTDRNTSFTIEVPVRTAAVTDLFTGQRLRVEKGRAAVSFISQVYPSGKTYPMGRIFIYD